LAAKKAASSTYTLPPPEDVAKPLRISWSVASSPTAPVGVNEPFIGITPVIPSQPIRFAPAATPTAAPWVERSSTY